VSADAVSLLRALGGGARPLGISGAGAATGTARSGTAAGVPFADLLARAQTGEVASALPVTVTNGAGVNLSEDQLQRLSVAADRAEASGATRALVLIDGMALRLDVGVRQITGTAELGAGAALSGIDGVVRAPESADSGANESISVGVPRSGAPGLNATLLRALARATEPGTDDRAV